jgi:hypothetical protein
MSSITLDQATIDKLQGPGTPLKILDAQGKVIGTFEPAARVYRRGEIPDISEAELDRRAKESPRMTTDELLRRLKDR